ncbi:MAG: hypothetical protein R2828_03695 [Saprospiraceae bacterium]
MFLINPYLRFALMAVGIIGGIALSALYGFWYGFPFWLTGLILLGGYVLLGTVGSAAKAMQTMDMDKAEKLLNLTISPRLLYSTNRAYFYMVKGSVALAQKKTEEGEKWLRMAEEIDVPTDNERAMLQIQLANISASKNKWQQAQTHYRNAKAMKITQSEIREQLKQFEKVLSNRGQSKAAMRMGGGQKGGMMIPGGKRKRPKMR